MRHVVLCLLTLSSDIRIKGSVLSFFFVLFSFFFLLSSFFFSHPESCVKFKIFASETVWDQSSGHKIGRHGVTEGDPPEQGSCAACATDVNGNETNFALWTHPGWSAR